MPTSDALADLITKRLVQQRVYECILGELPPALCTPQLAVALRRALAALPIRDCLEVAVPYHADLEAEVEEDGAVTVLLDRGHGEAKVVDISDGLLLDPERDADAVVS
jgi:hypothetical protein